MQIYKYIKLSLFIKLLVCLVAVCGVSANGQDYFRRLGTPNQTSQVLPYEVTEENTDLAQARHVLLQQGEEEKYNLALGPLRFSASAGMGAEWTDNVGLSAVNRQSDFILTPSVNIDTKWRMTEINTLHFSIGMGYSYYTQHSQYNTNGLIFSPNSEIAFTIHVGNFAFTVRDQFALLNDAIALIGIPNNQGNGNFRRFQNLAGVTTDWVVNPVFDLEVSYDHYNMWVLGSNLAGYNVSDQNIDSFSLTPRYKIGPGITLGLNTSASFVQYSGTETDAQTYMIGPFIDANVTKNTRIYFGAGYQYFGRAGNDSEWTVDNSSSFYVRTAIDNRLSSIFSHRITFTHTTEAGYNSAYYELYDLEYTANWRVNNNMVVDFRALYQHFDTPGTGGSIGNRYGAEIGTRYQLTPSVSMGVSYRYVNNNENIPNSNAYQDSVLFNVFYSF